MDVLEALRTRRSIYDFRPDPLPAATIQRILEYATWAPNHHLTQPWRFTIVGPETKAALTDALGSHTLAHHPSADPAARAAARDKFVTRFLGKPSVVAVTCVQSDNPEQHQEDLAAIAAAMQNIQLAAWAEGLGVQISTGPVTKLPDTPTILGLPDDEAIVAFLFLGAPNVIPKAPRRRPIEEVARSVP
jgi:nitroreductase